MILIKNLSRPILTLCLLLIVIISARAQAPKPKFHVIAFYTGKNDLAHISFVHEANKWFPKMAAKYNFAYDSTSNWSNMNAEFLSHYQAVIFLDTRPEDPAARSAFQKYMENGGGWIGFHFSAFALTPSDVPANWDWYHNTFLGSGQYVSNTWHPASAILRVEDLRHPATKGLPTIWKSQPNEWYRWEKNLRANPDITILLAIDSTSFPLGNGPNPNEIWHSGYYPVVWTNKNYKMVYMNMGHNDMDYDHHTNKELSQTLDNVNEEKLILNSLIWVATGKKTSK